MYFQITCSNCGHRSQKLPYNAGKTPDRIINAGWNSFGGVFYCPKCARTWETRNGKNRPLWGEDHTRNLIFERMIYELTDAIAYRDEDQAL